MVCPFCEHRNTPGSVVCSNCGAVLRGAVAEKPAHRPQRRTKSLFNWLSGGKTRQIHQRHAHLASEIKHTLTVAEERFEREMKSPQPSQEVRLGLAALHLLKEENEKAIQVLQVARQLGTGGTEWENNAGVALARRGSLSEALKQFHAAAAHPDAPAQPHANEAHVLVELLVGPEAVEHATLAIRHALSRAGHQPSYYNLLGKVFAGDERLGDARHQFEHALKLAKDSLPAQADAHNNLGVVLHRDGEEREALAAFAAALAADPGHAPALANQGLLQFLAGEKEPGLEHILGAAQVDPQSAGVHAAVGYAQCVEGNINEGIRAFHQAQTLDHHLFEAHANLGKAYADCGLSDIAERHLEKAYRLIPRSWQVMQTAGVVKLAQNQIPAAISFFENALKIKPQHQPLLINLAVAYALSGRDLEAKRRLEHAGRLNENNPSLHGHWGWLYLREDSATLATGEIEIAIQKNPRSGILHNNLGLAQIGVGSYEVALESLQRALRRDPHLHPVHYHIGAVHALLKDPDQAVKAWEIAAKYELTNPDCFANLGAAYYRKGEYDTAIVHFRHVLQLRQDRPEDYSNLGLSYAKQGVALRKKADSVSKATALIGLGAAEERMKESLVKHKHAIEMFDQAIALDERNVIIHSNRGLACFFANRAEEAMKEWANVTRIDPLYVRRRGKAHQTEFDDSQVDFIPLDVPKRALILALETADYLPHLLWGYDTDRWEMIVSDAELLPLPAKIEELHALERVQRAMTL